MKAVVYQGPFEVAVKEVPDPIIQHPADAIVEVTTTCICGSDLHMYEGRTAAEPGIVFGHENMGVVIEVGSAVSRLKVGDRVVMPFNIGCGHCQNCERGFTGFCTEVNPGFAGGAYGYVAMGPYPGGQAQYLRVPWADFNALELPQGEENELDYALLADIFPTGWHGVTLSGFEPGESVAVFGGGPVGLMAAYSAVLRGASEVYVVDRIPERLEKARAIGATAINFDHSDAVDQILDRRHGAMVDRAVDAVGYQAVQNGREVPNTVLLSMVRVVRPTGGLGVPGLYVPSDPGGADPLAKEGFLSFPVGKFFEKGLKMGTGQCNVKTYNRHLRNMISAGKARPSFVVSHEIPLDDAPTAYEKFDRRVEGYTKVLIHPNG